MLTKKVALIGAGFMAANHARVISGSQRAMLEVVIDVDKNRALELAEPFGARASTDVRAALSCDAAVVASSTETHADISLALIESRIPLLVEKPLASSLDDVRRICASAEKNHVALSCGFVERFNPVVTTVLEMLEDEPIHIVSLRHSPAAPRMSNSVIHDLLIHDIDLTLRFSHGNEVLGVRGSHWLSSTGVEEIVDCMLQLSGGAVATLSASRMSQRKVRTTQIFTGSVLYDLDLLRTDLTVYRNVMQEQLEPMTYRSETVIDIPFIRHAGEPLALQFEHFLNIANGIENAAIELGSIAAAHEVAHALECEIHTATKDSERAASG